MPIFVHLFDNLKIQMYVIGSLEPQILWIFFCFCLLKALLLLFAIHCFQFYVTLII